MTRCDRTAAWGLLHAHHDPSFDLRAAFAADARRFDTFSLQAPEVFADLSKQRWDTRARDLLLALARECGLETQRDAMFAGAPINRSEGRAVLHTALRAPRGAGPHSDDVHATLDAMLEFAESVRADAAITDIVHIGIGGSDLGPQMAVQALAGHVHPRLALHFVSNVDAHQITQVLKPLQPQRTLVIVASKTFTTQETMTNAQIARDWFVANGGRDIAHHFAATTTNVAAAAAFGIETTFGFWDWVGGRYSMWSAIGLPIAIAIGADAFRAMLAGAHAMDCHFAEAPLEHNLPAQLGLLDIWQRNVEGFTSRSVAPYHQGLARLPAYLQQLEMESNGKSVSAAGEPLPFATSPVVWGEPGTNGQHAYFQMLHQGTDIVPLEFIAVRRASHGHEDSHTKLLANCLAQSQALMLGRPAAANADVVARQRHVAGNRPSTTLVLDALNPRSLGALIAMYEHRVFTAGALWGINPFDQWGVELGKALAGELLPLFASGDTAGLDGSTAGLLESLRTDGTHSP
jgi:glucose-6-phosphate isomerase